VAVQGGTCSLLDGGDFNQVYDLAVEILLCWVLRLGQCLQVDGCHRDVLAHAELLWESHASIVVDVMVDPKRALPHDSTRVPSLWLRVRRGGGFAGGGVCSSWGRSSLM